MKVQDRALEDTPPWQSVESMIEELARSLEGPDPGRLLDLLHEHLRDAGPWFRARALKRDIGFLERHPLARDIMIYVGGPVMAALVFVLFALRP